MQGNDVFRFAVGILKESIENVLEQAHLTIEDISLIIPHQANYRIINRVAKRMKIDISKFYVNLQDYGNISVASIPIAYAEACEKGLMKDYKRVILVGFGSGLTYGATLVDQVGGRDCAK